MERKVVISEKWTDLAFVHKPCGVYSRVGVEYYIEIYNDGEFHIVGYIMSDIEDVVKIDFGELIYTASLYKSEMEVKDNSFDGVAFHLRCEHKQDFCVHFIEGVVDYGQKVSVKKGKFFDVNIKPEGELPLGDVLLINAFRKQFCVLTSDILGVTKNTEMEEEILEEEINVKSGQSYRHFKGFIATVITIAEHTETGEPMVVYTCTAPDGMQGGTSKHNNGIYVRPLKMFISKVDRIKYPDVEQEYRFELMQ